MSYKKYLKKLNKSYDDSLYVYITTRYLYLIYYDFYTMPEQQDCGEDHTCIYRTSKIKTFLKNHEINIPDMKRGTKYFISSLPNYYKQVTPTIIKEDKEDNRTVEQRFDDLISSCKINIKYN